jgi:hypothetical protein
MGALTYYENQAAVDAQIDRGVKESMELAARLQIRCCGNGSLI